jgi:hypothetical protein
MRVEEEKNPRNKKKFQNGSEQFAAFCLFMGTLLKKMCFTRRERNFSEIKDDNKIKRQKKTSIATVRDLLRTFDIFSAPLLSHYRLPLRVLNVKEAMRAAIPPPSSAHQKIRGI